MAEAQEYERLHASMCMDLVDELEEKNGRPDEILNVLYELWNRTLDGERFDKIIPTLVIPASYSHHERVGEFTSETESATSSDSSTDSSDSSDSSDESDESDSSEPKKISNQLKTKGLGQLYGKKLSQLDRYFKVKLIYPGATKIVCVDQHKFLTSNHLTPVTSFRTPTRGWWGQVLMTPSNNGKKIDFRSYPYQVQDAVIMGECEKMGQIDARNIRAYIFHM